MRPRTSLLSFLLAVPLTFACGDKDPVDEEDDETPDDTGEPDGDDTGGGGGSVTDLDHDGYTSDVDCDDNDYEVFPGAPELCDGVDNDCDGETDEDYDSDGDGFFDAAACDSGRDCDDADAAINPAATEIPYDGVDQDCDGGDLTDVDGDGFASTVAGGSDCDDADATIHPGAAEVAKDDVDQDCDGADLLDEDGDGFDDEAYGGDDCDDADPAVNPGVFDWMNDETDADCDGRDGRALAMIDALVTIDGTASQQQYTGSGVAICDLDDDGIDDLVVSAPLHSTSAYEGVIGVWYGWGASTWTANMAMTDADTLISGSQYRFLGLGLGCADIDGDGYFDIVAGSGEYGPTDSEFGLYVFYGTGGSLSASMSDLDADAVLSYPLGAPSGESSTVYSNNFALGDLDGDGAAEIAMFASVSDYASDGSTSPGDDTVWILPGQAWSGTELIATDTDHASVAQDQEGALSTWRIEPDVDGDGLGELWFGQGNYSETEEVTDATTGETTEETTYVGWASVISGIPTSDGPAADVAWADLRNASGAEMAFGWSGTFGDFDGDGATDAVVSAITQPYGGAANAGGLYFYSDVATTWTGTGLDPFTLADADVQGQWEDGYLGSRLWQLGDMDGDGADDLLVREPGGGSGGSGRIRVVSGARLGGSALNVDDIQLMELRAEDSSSSTGTSAAIGDIDGDGTVDLVIPARTWGYASTGASTGRVYLYLSSLYGFGG